jgi:hypothetical protein
MIDKKIFIYAGKNKWVMGYREDKRLVRIKYTPRIMNYNDPQDDDTWMMKICNMVRDAINKKEYENIMIVLTSDEDIVSTITKEGYLDKSIIGNIISRLYLNEDIIKDHEGNGDDYVSIIKEMIGCIENFSGKEKEL